MTLEDATRQTLAAAAAGDLETVTKALAARSEAIAAGGVPTLEIVAMGQQTLELLRGLMRAGVIESVRLGQIQAGFAGSFNTPRAIDYLG